MSTALPAGVRRLIEVLRTVADIERTGHVNGGLTEAQVAMTRPALQSALVDETTRDLYSGREKSFLVWSAPGSVALHASVHRPAHVTRPHDHGPAWAVYGVVSGPTTFSRYERGPDTAPGVASLGSRVDQELPPGETEVVWPGQVHAVANRGDDWGWNLVVRSRLLNQITRAVFDASTGAYRMQGPATRAK